MPVECEHCHEKFLDDNHLATHQTICAKIMENNIEPGMCNKVNEHTCPECGKKFQWKHAMVRHQWIHRIKKHMCEVCDSQFEKQSELKNHRLSVHSHDKLHICPECAKSFSSRCNLQQHSRTHNPIRFQCDKCSKTFSSRQNHMIHYRIHTGERPYKCKLCRKTFTQSSNLKVHERIHTGEKPYVCPLCSQAFTQKGSLLNHVRMIHIADNNRTETSDLYTCVLCNTPNLKPDEFCAHIIKHSDHLRTGNNEKNDSDLKSNL